MPVWHASVSISQSAGIWRARAWPKAVLRDAITRGMILLFGVGTGDTLRHWGDFAIHIRRQVTPKELRQLERLTPGWCTIPAQDIAGGDDLILDSDLTGDSK